MGVRRGRRSSGGVERGPRRLRGVIRMFVIMSMIIVANCQHLVFIITNTYYYEYWVTLAGPGGVAFGGPRGRGVVQALVALPGGSRGSRRAPREAEHQTSAGARVGLKL